MTDLTAHVLAVAFWSLAKRRAIDVTLTHSARLRRRRVQVVRLRRERSRSIEGAIMTVPNIDPDAFVDDDTAGLPGPLGDVPSVLAQILQSGEDPEWGIIEMVLDDGEDCGLVVPAERPGKRRGIDCRAVTEHRDSFDRLRTGWLASVSEAPRLHRQLLKDCRKAISNAREYPEADGPLRMIASLVFRISNRADRPWPRTMSRPADGGSSGRANA